MTQAMDPFAGPVDPRLKVWDRPADRLRETAEQRYDRARQNPSLNNDAKLALIAKAWISLRDQMAQLQQSSGTTTADRLAAARRKLHGIDDLARNASPAERAQMAISHRDAQDRAAQIETPAAAQQLLDTATQTGDELLARAVGSHAINRSTDFFGSGYGDVVDSYLGTRPAQAQAYQDVQSMRQNLDTATMFEYVTPKPPELAAMNDARVQSLANDGGRYAQTP